MARKKSEQTVTPGTKNSVIVHADYWLFVDGQREHGEHECKPAINSNYYGLKLTCCICDRPL